MNSSEGYDLKSCETDVIGFSFRVSFMSIFLWLMKLEDLIH